MNRETITLKKKEWPRVEVISRIVSNDNVVQWDGRRLQILPQPRRYSFAGAKVLLHQALDGRLSLYHGDTRLEHTSAPPG